MATKENNKTEDQKIEDANAAENTEGAKPEETPRQAFERIGKRRMSNVLTAIGTLNGLTNPSNYDFTPQHWQAIFSAIDNAVKEVKERLETGNKATASFTFGADIPVEQQPAPEGDGSPAQA